MNALAFILAWFSASGGPPQTALEAAHLAFLDRDYPHMTEAIRTVLADPATDAVTRQNVLGLLARAYEDADGRLPADWTPPEGVTNLRLSQLRRQEPDDVSFKVELMGDVAERDTLTQVRLVRHPDDVVLDRQLKRGDWEVDLDDDGTLTFSLERDRVEPLQEGLYLIELERKDGRRTTGWTIVSDLASTASPRVDSPAIGQTFTTGNPELRWEDFRSPQAKPFEVHKLHVYVVKLTPQAPGWDLRWGLYLDNPLVHDAVVGKTASAHGVAALEPGMYWLGVTYLDQRSLGPVRLRRGSRTARQFHVH